MSYRGFKIDVLDDGFSFIWYETSLIDVALNPKYAKKRIDNMLRQIAE